MSLDFLYYPIAWALKQWHALMSLFLEPSSGVAWVLSIMMLVVTVRIILFPIFVKMIKSQRAMQELQPDIAKLRKEYGSDRQGMAVAMQQLQRERGVNPLAGCLPLLLQAPVFIALLHVLRRLHPDAEGSYVGRGLYTWSDQLTQQAAEAEVFGAPISSTFTMSGYQLEQLVAATGTSGGTIKLVTGILIIVMAVTQFITTKQIMKRSATGEINAQMQMIQKLMLYGAPIGLLISGLIFPLGVLLYWFFNNLWTIGQQFWVLKRLPPPGGVTENKTDVAIDRTKLAPRPGARPAAKSKKPATTAPAATAPAATTSAAPAAAVDSTTAAEPSSVTSTVTPAATDSTAAASSSSVARPSAASPIEQNASWRDRFKRRTDPNDVVATPDESASSGPFIEQSDSDEPAKTLGTAPKPGARPNQQIKRKKR